MMPKFIPTHLIVRIGVVLAYTALAADSQVQWTSVEDTRLPVPPAEHPRLYLRAEHVAKLPARLKHPVLQPALERLLDLTRNSPQTRVEWDALQYLVTGDAKLGRGVIENALHQRLYALGLAELRAYSLQHGETDTPSLLREKTWKIPGTSGHDLSRMSADELLITYHEGVSVFRIPTESFAPFAPLANVENVKSVNYDPSTQCLVYTKAEISWWTHHVYSRNPDRAFTFPGINLYKARVTSP